MRKPLAALLAVTLLFGSALSAPTVLAKEAAFSPGDANGDGRVTVRDAVLIARHIVGGYNVELDALAVDTDGDRLLTLRDVIRVARYVVDDDATMLMPLDSIHPVNCTSSGDYSTDYAAANAFDGNLDTAWLCNDWGGTRHLTATFASTVTLDGMQIMWNCDNKGNPLWSTDEDPGRSDQYRIQGSTSESGNDFVDLYTYDGAHDSAFDIITFSEPVTVRRLRLYTDKGEGRPSIREIHFVKAELLDGVTLTLSPDGTSYAVTAAENQGEIIIPATYKGIPVTSISANAFDGCVDLHTVTLPYTVKTVETGAFSDTQKLTRVLYTGTDWNTVAVGDDNASLLTATRLINAEGLFVEQDGIAYWRVSASGAFGNGTYDDSAYFLEGMEGYYLDEGLYLLDENTINRVIGTPCAGDGSVQWKDFKKGTGTVNTDPFTGILPASKTCDPLYTAMCKPSELPTVMNRVNATNMYPAEDRFKWIMTIGAVYLRSDMIIPDDMEFTICIGRTTLALNTEEKGWHLASDIPYLKDDPNKLYFLPWTLESELGAYTIPPEKVKLVGDHYEVSLTGADLNATQIKTQYPDYADRITGTVLHFWGENYALESGLDVLGMVGSFEVWVKEPEAANLLVAAIGADWREADGSGGEQAYSGYNFAITNEPRVVYGHNVGPNSYDTVMDSETVQELIGIN